MGRASRGRPLVARAPEILADTHWLGGDPAQGQVYGWASWSPCQAILALRNPNDQPAELALDIAQAFELPAGSPRHYRLNSPWHADAGQPALDLKAGEPHRFQLAPFAVLVFDAEAVASAP